MGGHGMNNLIHLPEHVTGWICEDGETAFNAIEHQARKGKK